MTAPYYADERITLHLGDCIEVMRGLPDASMDAVVTDPPYGLEFMGKDWDRFGTGKRPTIGQPDGSKFRQNMGTPSFTDNGNPTCRNCGGDKYRNGPRKCSCDSPDFGNPQAQSMHGFQQWCELWARECLRVLKPGGHLLAFGGTRTWHRLTVAVEDAGFEIRDSIAWLYGSGFPKSLDVSKAIDKAAGAEREVVGRYTPPNGKAWNLSADESAPGYSGGLGLRSASLDRTAPATDAARTWQGWGTALKPAFEPVVVGRKPLVGTVAANVLAHGTGALNIDACRIGTTDRWVASGVQSAPGIAYEGSVDGSLNRSVSSTHEGGRWPANVVLDEGQAAELDLRSGVSQSRVGKPRGAASGDGWGMTATGAEYADSGGASRFFYVVRRDQPCGSASTAGPNSNPPSGHGGSAPNDAATSESLGIRLPTGSPSISETPTGSNRSGATATQGAASTAPKSSPEPPPVRHTLQLSPARSAAQRGQTDTTTTTANRSTSDGFAESTTFSTTPPSAAAGDMDSALASARFIYVAKAGQKERPKLDGTGHPTVKPLELMRWLVRLVTPPGGVVLEPFLGSGTTAEACIVEGFRCIGIERDEQYMGLVRARLSKPISPVLDFGLPA